MGLASSCFQLQWHFRFAYVILEGGVLCIQSSYAALNTEWLRILAGGLRVAALDQAT